MSMILCSLSFSERQRRWKEELDEELERKRGKFYFYFLSSVESKVLCIAKFSVFVAFQNLFASVNRSFPIWW